MICGQQTKKLRGFHEAFKKYAKSKEPKVKTIDIGKYFDLGRTLSSLSKSERETLSWILNKSFGGKE
jgi:hypothetical protein